jgi:preprotein translocase SecE subunit
MKDVVRFLQEVQFELGKIAWPSFNELVGSVIVVLILVFIFSIYIGGIDVIFYTLAGRIF